MRRGKASNCWLAKEKKGDYHCAVLLPKRAVAVVKPASSKKRKRKKGRVALQTHSRRKVFELKKEKIRLSLLLFPSEGGKAEENNHTKDSISCPPEIEKGGESEHFRH